MIFLTPKFTVYDVAKDLCLAIKPVDDLPDGCAGFLEPGPEPTFIAINAKHSSDEQIFTIAHELGHYFLHPGHKTRFQSHWLTNLQWRSFGRKLRRTIPKVFSREDEADMWAMGLLMATGAITELWHHVKSHPKQKKLFYLILVGFAITTRRQLPFLWLKVLFKIEVTTTR